MKTTKLLLGILIVMICYNNSIAQFWITAGNTLTGVEKLGSVNNLPLNMFTNNTHRMRINEAIAPTINLVTLARDGCVGIAPSGFFATNSPWSMLHLDGPTNFGPLTLIWGWRSWMNTGTYSKENSDNMYVGMKDEKNGVRVSGASYQIFDGTSNKPVLWFNQDPSSIFVGVGAGINTSMSGTTLANTFVACKPDRF